jgi:hypothetical protein
MSESLRGEPEARTSLGRPIMGMALVFGESSGLFERAEDLPESPA